MKTTINVRVNGEDRQVEIDTRMIVAEMMRERLRLTGEHIGCATGNCGACTVVMDGRTVKSCCVLAAGVDGADITTIEGLGTAEALDPLQQAFIDHGGFQCGICTPGQIMAARALLDDNPQPTELEIKEWMMGNLCRCTGYYKIIEAIQAVASSAGAGAASVPSPSTGEG